MIVTTDNYQVKPANQETAEVMAYAMGIRTEYQIIKEYFGINDDEFKNTKRLKELGVKYLPRLGDLGVSEEKFNKIFDNVLDNADTEGTTQKSSNTSTTRAKRK